MVKIGLVLENDRGFVLTYIGFAGKGPTPMEGGQKEGEATESLEDGRGGRSFGKRVWVRLGHP